MIWRKAGHKDIHQIVAARKQQLIDEGIAPDTSIDTELTDYFSNGLKDGTLVEWVVEDDDCIVATAAIAFYLFPPSYTNPTGKKGYVTNMYTVSGYRGRGIAGALLEKLVEEAKARGVFKLWLGASEMGRPVYERFGFYGVDVYMEMDIESN